MAIGWIRRYLGVRLRSALAAATVVAAAFAVGAAAFVLIARADLASNVDATARQRAAEVVAAVAAGDRDALAQTLKPSPGEQTLVQVLDPSGRVEAASAALGGAAPLSPLRPRPGELLREQRLLPFADEDPFRIAAEGVATGSGTRTVLVAQSLRPVNESTEAVAAILAAGLAPMLLVVGAAVFWFVGRSLRPVEAIRRRVAGITARDLHARVPVPAARDEVAALAETMNLMLERLETAAASQRRFVADASHELRSPLATLRAGLDRLALAAVPKGTANWSSCCAARPAGSVISSRTCCCSRASTSGAPPGAATTSTSTISPTPSGSGSPGSTRISSSGSTSPRCG
ncbi:HAMP domain-containing protein [Micromonospora sp. BRA006-A]|nr:HAMP domain-containing protein [Micromonospora sp. BRA006-A]